MFAKDPIVLELVTSGITFLVSVSPKTFIVPPMFTSPATPAPPLTTKLPVPKFVLAVVPSIVIPWLTLIFPVTSNASLGAVLLIPIFVVESTRITVFVVP